MRLRSQDVQRRCSAARSSLSYTACVRRASLIELTERGMYCAAGDFYIDPQRPVDRAVLTHAHSDHARPGHRRSIVSRDGERVFRTRLGASAALEPVAYGERVTLDGVTVSLHPAGHILGSAQVRVEYRGEVWVASGDYKTVPDPTCAPFEPVRCHHFITEATFGLPVYRWPAQRMVFDDVNAWWRANREAGRTSLVLAYALGKAQRVLAGVDASIGPIVTHGSVERLTCDYRESGVVLPHTEFVTEGVDRVDLEGALVVAPSSVLGSPWLERFGSISTAFMSGWMLIRGARRRQSFDRGFPISDHADWDELNSAIAATEAETIWVTHGSSDVLVRWLREAGKDARTLKTFRDEAIDDDAPEDATA